MSNSMESDADFLLLSGIKHFCFCQRRWALVHIEQQWQEKLVTDIPDGAIYYGKIRRRVPVAFTAELRRMTTEAIAEMHRLFARGHTPKAKWTKACKSCSLVEVCQPLLAKRMSASAYVRQMLEEDRP